MTKFALGSSIIRVTRKKIKVKKRNVQNQTEWKKEQIIMNIYSHRKRRFLNSSLFDRKWWKLCMVSGSIASKLSKRNVTLKRHKTHRSNNSKPIFSSTPWIAYILKVDNHREQFLRWFCSNVIVSISCRWFHFVSSLFLSFFLLFSFQFIQSKQKNKTKEFARAPENTKSYSITSDFIVIYFRFCYFAPKMSDFQPCQPS